MVRSKEEERDPGSNLPMIDQNLNSIQFTQLAHINGSFSMESGGWSSIPKLVLISNYLNLIICLIICMLVYGIIYRYCVALEVN